MDKYRVIVLREGADNDETLFEIAGAASMVGRIAPGALLEALSADTDRSADESPSPAAPAGNIADRVFDDAVAAGRAAEAQAAAPGGETTKTRTRRTKAQKAADDEAQGLGFRDAAHRAEVEAQQQTPGTPTGAVPAEVPSGPVVTTTFEGAAPVPTGFPAVTSVPASAPAAPAGNGEAPWNPFTQS
jgi:hypothetical protein